MSRTSVVHKTLIRRQKHGLLILQLFISAKTLHLTCIIALEILELYGSIGQFTQQGLEKLNDLTTSMQQAIMNKRH